MRPSPMNGDGKRVAQTINGETTYFVGNYYEQTGSTITKYYYAGSSRVAMKTGSTVYYLLSDHLAPSAALQGCYARSTSLTTDASGNVVSELRYSAWGSVRYQAGSTPTEYTYTGQYSDGYINLLDYGSRRYDPELGRFISPDSIVPLASQGVQAWDRYAYVSNDPVRYNDPTGHCPTCLIGAGVGGLVGGIAYGAYAAYTGNFNGWHLAAAIGGGALAGALIGSAVGAPAAAEVAATTAATVTGGGAAVLEATGGDPSDEIRVVEQTVQGTGQVVNDLIARSELIEKASNELVYQSPGGLNGAREVFNSLGGNVNEIAAKGGTILNKTLDSGGQVLFRTWPSVTRNLPSTPVLQFKDIPGFETLLKFHFPE